MPENEFEKRVQQKMNEFNLPPSEQVWKGVESRIRKEKKRRFIIWWPLLFLLLGGSIATGIIFNNIKGEKEKITTNGNTDNTSQTTTKKTIIPEPNVNENSTGNNIAVTKTRDKVNNKSEEVKPSSGKTANIIIQGKWSVQKKTAVAKKKKPVNEDIKKDIDVAPSGDQDTQPTITIISSVKQDDPIADSTSNKDIAAVKKNDVQQEKDAGPDSITAEQKTKTTNKKTTNWDLGIAVSGGRSAVVSGFNIFNKSLNADALAQSPTGGAPNIFAPSAIHSSASWGLELYLKRPVSKKLDMNIGLGYSYLSTKMNVGSRVDTARTISNTYSGPLTVNDYYRPSGASGGQSYTNQYHFLYLSGQLSWRIITGKKVRVYWDNGISYHQMLTSTMLHYDPSLPGYYRDNRQLTKNQVFVSTGFSVPVSKRFMISPFSSYSLTTVLKNKTDRGTHFAQFGIRIKYGLNKK